MLNLFQNVLRRFKEECLTKGYELILEADVAGWLFHLLLTEPGIKPEQPHLNARVGDARGFFDIAIGSLRSRADGKPCVDPELVVEVKLFPRLGFTDQQHRVHYMHILNDDLTKLGILGQGGGCRVCLVVDGAGYLEGAYQHTNRMEFLVDRRNHVASGTHLFVVRLVQGKWEIQHEPPL